MALITPPVRLVVTARIEGFDELLQFLLYLSHSLQLLSQLHPPPGQQASLNTTILGAKVRGTGHFLRGTGYRTCDLGDGITGCRPPPPPTRSYGR
jgi:hypothetical protein